MKNFMNAYGRGKNYAGKAARVWHESGIFYTIILHRLVQRNNASSAAQGRGEKGEDRFFVHDCSCASQWDYSTG